MDESESDGVDTPASDFVASIVDAPHLTKTTWRASKHHRLVKRVHNFGGVTVAPAAFLEAAKRTQFQKDRPGHRVCSAMKKDGNPCRMLALKGMKVCLAHGGQAALARQGRYQPSGRAAAAIAAKAEAMRAKMPEDRVPNAPPFELTRLRVYVEANEWTRLRLIRAWGTEGWHGLVRQLRSRDDPPGGDRNR
jgi:hypothetical protein